MIKHQSIRANTLKLVKNPSGVVRAHKNQYLSKKWRQRDTSLCTRELSAVGEKTFRLYRVQDNLKGLQLIKFNMFSIFLRAHVANWIPTLYAKLWNKSTSSKILARESAKATVWTIH